MPESTKHIDRGRWNVLGLDLSLSSTGVARADGSLETLRSRDTGMPRLAALRDAVVDRTVLSFSIQSVDLVVLEGYSMGTARQQSHAHALGELGGVVRLALWERRIPFVDVAPASLKKYATGKGNANKGQMLEAAVRRSGGVDFGGDDNRADAWWLRAMALDRLGEPVAAMPAASRVALDAVHWPKSLFVGAAS